MTVSPPFSDEHEELRTSIRGFIARELTPHAQQWERDEWFPDEVFPKLAAQGLLGLKYPTALGGQGGDYLHEAVLVEELARIGSRRYRRRHRRAREHRHAADLEVRHQTTRSSDTWCQRSKAS